MCIVCSVALFELFKIHSHPKAWLIGQTDLLSEIGSTSSTLSVSSRPPMASTPTPILPPPGISYFCDVCICSI